MLAPALSPLLTLGLLSAPAVAQTPPDWALRNGHFDVRGAGAVITHLGLDPSGKGRYGRNLLRRMGFRGLETRQDSRVTVDARHVRVSGGLVVEPLALVSESTDAPAQLLAGHTLGQSFTVDAATFTEVSAHLPTWATTDSAATLTLRRGGPAGEVVATRRLQDIPDNSWQRLAFDPQPAGLYYLELSDLRGQVGWWSHSQDVFPQGQAFADGEPLPSGDRHIRVTGERPVGEGALGIALQGSRLRLTVDVKPLQPGPPRVLPLQCVTYWQQDGYEVSADTTPFARYFSDQQRYMPAQQLKRSPVSENLTIGGVQWIEAEGTADHDLRFEAPGLGLAWEGAGEDLTHTFTTAASEAEGAHRTGITLVALPRRDSVPEDWPTFETPDRTLTEELNCFWWERAFTYGSPAGPAAWFDWMPTIRDWHAGPWREAEAQNLRGVPIDAEGYVYTWGASPGWPFPDPVRYDTRHFDTNARYILGCRRHVAWTHDEAFLRSQAERLRRAMSYQLTTLQGESGLIVAAGKDVTGRHQGVGNNYWDILPFGHLDAYANVVFYASLGAMAELETFIDRAGGIETAGPRRSPDEYRRLAEQTKAAYNRAFWDDGKGRYIGCVDRDGKRHDYGFTFVNLEAMAYGLAGAEQAARIYHWMEAEPTATGKADTYSAWRFAPRANTIHNPVWDPATGVSKEPGSAEPWWHFGWLGTPYGDQCQDGGAILYTSFFDLMARTRLVGVESAWQRWTELLARWREPDHLCGGAPLLHGENPQRVNPGSVGVDLPFPESGLVPTWFVYGLMGLEADTDGLHIRPCLPKALSWLAVRNADYRGLRLDIRVTPTSARLVSRTPGYEFTWERTFPPGEGCLFAEPPPPLKGFPPATAASGITAEWIWAPPTVQEEETVYLRRALDLDEKPERAFADLAVDNSWTLFVNGREVQSGQGWETATRVNLAACLQPGRNAIGVRARNAGGPGGALIRVTLGRADKPTVIDSGPTWRASREAPNDWASPDFDDSAWPEALSLGQPPTGPWGNVRLP